VGLTNAYERMDGQTVNEICRC